MKLLINKKYKFLLIYFFWSLASLVWGILSWSMWKATIIPIPLKWLIMATALSIIIIVFFYHSLHNALSCKRLYFLNIPLPLPPWWFFLVLSFFGISLCFIPRLLENKFIFYFVQGILLSSILEEFITRSLFIKYKMTLSEFFFFNFLSALSFSFMHCFYGEGIIQALTVGHFPFCFALSIIAYKTKRIELTILLHMFSNFVLYTMPVMIFDNFNHPFVGFGNSVFLMLFYICLAGYVYSVPRQRYSK